MPDAGGGEPQEEDYTKLTNKPEPEPEHTGSRPESTAQKNPEPPPRFDYAPGRRGDHPVIPGSAALRGVRQARVPSDSEPAGPDSKRRAGEEMPGTRHALRKLSDEDGAELSTRPSRV